jgi:hypothetical protein
MRDEISPFSEVLVNFRPALRSRSFANFVVLITGWVLCVGRHSLTRILQFGAGGWGKHHSVLYRFLSRARWLVDGLSRILVGLILPTTGTGDIYLLVDDTLARRSGPHLWGAGMYHDPLNSNYGRGAQSRTVTFAYGQSWVIVSLWVPLPWEPDRGLALPVACRLYRAKKHCEATEYHKRTDLAVELLDLVASWLPNERRLVVLGDSEYTCCTVIRKAPSARVFVGPMDMRAALYLPASPKRGRGRPAHKGARLPSPKTLAADNTVPWQSVTVRLYGHAAVKVLVKTQVGLWFRVAGARLVRMVVTRDPKGRMDDRAYVSTDPQMDVGLILTLYSKRWPQEVMHANIKQHLGAQDPQNGWWRRSSTDPAPSRKIAGPQPHTKRGALQTQRTFPCVLLVYSLVVLWYFLHGEPTRDVQRVRQRAPWYRHKAEPSFADMLAALRCHLWAERFSREGADDGGGLQFPANEADGTTALIELLAASS